MVEHTTDNRAVDGSSPSVRTNCLLRAKYLVVEFDNVTTMHTPNRKGVIWRISERLMSGGIAPKEIKITNWVAGQFQSTSQMVKVLQPPI